MKSGHSALKNVALWLNPHLSSEPKVETVNTIYHEYLHIKYQKKAEREITRLTNKIILVTKSLTSKKKKFDITHSH